MNRGEIKNKAKEMIKNNKWYILKPLIIIGLIIGAIEGFALGLDSILGLAKEQVIELSSEIKFNYTSGGIISNIVGIVTGIASSALTIAYAHYILSFVRGKKLTLNDVFEFMKKNWVISFLVSLLAGLIIMGCTLLLIIPGIIASIGLMFYQEVCADNLEMKPMEIIKKSWNMTKGYKMELFVFGLSFIGWCLLAGFTLGILYIWLFPYIIVSLTLAYENLKNNS